MKLQQFVLFGFILCISIIEISAVDLDSDDDLVEDENEYRSLKLQLLSKKTTAIDDSGVLDDVDDPSLTLTQRSMDSRYYSGACASSPCEHGGICTPRGERIFDCKCVGPWRGIYCGIADACYRSPCRNGGSCLNVIDDYWCKCPTDYHGKNCESRFSNPGPSTNNCRPNICNTGRCVSLKTSYYCQCPDDRYGEHCEKRFSHFKRGSSGRQSFDELLEQFKRAMRDEILTDDNDNDA